MARTYGKAQDLIDFTRASGGTALRRVKYGAELVTNGTFDSDVSGWSAIGSISLVDQQLYWTNTNIGGAHTTISTEAGKIYRFTFDITVNSGTIRFSPRSGSLGGSKLANETLSTGSHTFDVVADGSEIVLYIQNLTATGGDFYLDNVSVKETIFDTSDGDLILFNHPNNIPRIEYDADGNLLGLLVEESRTNLVTYSEDFTQWSIPSGAATLEETVELNPANGNSYLLKDTTNSVEHNIKGTYFNITGGSTYTLSIFAKKQGKSIIRVGAENVGALPARVFFDLNAGTVTTQQLGSGSIQDVGNGWYRCTVVGTATSSVSTRMEINVVSSGTTITYVGDGTGVYIYGAQLEAGSFPTSYIPTSGSTATRSADVASIATSGFGFNSSEGSVVVDFNASKWIGLPSDGFYYRIVEFGGNFGSNADGVFRNAANNDVRYRFNEDDALTAAIGAGDLDAPSTSGNKVGFALKAGDNYIVMDGSTSGTGTGTAATNVYDVLLFGRTEGASNFMNGHIKSLKYYPRRLTNEQLQELTS